MRPVGRRRRANGSPPPQSFVLVDDRPARVEERELRISEDSLHAKLRQGRADPADEQCLGCIT